MVIFLIDGTNLHKFWKYVQDMERLMEKNDEMFGF